MTAGARRAAAVLATLACACAPLETSRVLTAPPDPFSQEAYRAWLSAEPGREADVATFQRFLADQGVSGVVEDWQLLRTATDAVACGGPTFALPPRELWPNIIGTLRFTRDAVIPRIGPVTAVSGYRPEPLNTCVGGARGSAHASYWAIDLRPGPEVTREALIPAICAVHEAQGLDARIGLGFYAGTRFHLDSRSFRRWGPDGTQYTSPCWAALGQNPPERPPPVETPAAQAPAPPNR